MKYALVTLAGRSRGTVSIDEDQHTSIVAAKAKLLECLVIEEKFDLVWQNYFEFEMTLLECAQKYLATPALDHPRTDAERALFNRRLANLLSAARTYVEQVSSRHLPAVLPAAPCEAVSSAFSTQYDALLGYRVMEALRNHVQHFDMPIQSVTYPSHRVERKSGFGLAFTVNPCLRPADLRRNTKFKHAVLEELEEIGESVDLKPLVREYVQGLWVVHAQIRDALAPLISEWEATLELAKSTYIATCQGETSAFALAAVTVGDDDAYVTCVQVFTEFNDYRRFLEAKNAALDGLALRFVTNEAADDRP